MPIELPQVVQLHQLTVSVIVLAPTGDVRRPKKKPPGLPGMTDSIPEDPKVIGVLELLKKLISP